MEAGLFSVVSSVLIIDAQAELELDTNEMAGKMIYTRWQIPSAP